MKKLLLILSSLLIIGTTSMSVVSCGIKPEKDVVFAIIGGATQSSGDLEKVSAYQEMADDYNEIHRNEQDFVPVKVQWKNSNYLNNSIMVGDNLPDLYISYVDAASTYLGTKIGNQVRDMEVSMGEKGFQKFTEDLITPAFINEGKYQDKQIVLPFGKSFDISVINVNTWIQFVSHVEGYTEAAKNLQKKFNQFNKSKRNLELGGDTESSNNQIFSNKLVIKDSSFANYGITSADYNNLKIIIDTCLKTAGVSAQSESDFSESNGDVQKAIKDVFATTNNVLLITKFMNAIVQEGLIEVKIQNRDSVTFEGKTLSKEEMDVLNNENADNRLDYTQKTNFGFGIDSVDNKFFMDYASSNIDGKELIDVEDPNNDFWYNSTYKSNQTKIQFNTKSSSFLETAEYLDGMKEIAKSNNNTDAATFSEQWNGVFSVARYDSPVIKSWITSDFIKGTMFMGSASSANDPYFAQQQKRVGDKVKINGKDEIVTTYFSPNKKADLLTAPKTNKNNTNRHVFMSQGRGIAGFKSNGPNAAQKEKSVTGFLNYIMQPKPTARFALRTSYVPATKSGMEIYKNYVNGSYNNLTGIVPEGRENLVEAVKIIEKRPNDVITDDDINEYFYQVKNSKGKPDPKVTVSPVMTGFIKEYLEPKIESEIKQLNSSDDVTLLVSSKALPSTDLIRTALKNSIDPNNGVMDLKNWKDIKFSEILDKFTNRKQYYLVEKWILTNESEFFKDIKVTRK
ncbi:hypothetical protein MENTO_v1c00200 [Mesoplasma entomophilum]|uniref:Lipoprotein n=1 Tax=Mesoplasma entomophilum TaxID=2149 RepID=A0A3S5XYE8_9MOLU|nr:hypothetical protein [Mesoplasma entomophilum]ATQ35185.1 hypothetical protein CS528_00100 [Mesoplasma entomophilum]ATZ19131.1 hypothetical protein MENTO_v1c00200 [Mesoplasma entomophilum]